MTDKTDKKRLKESQWLVVIALWERGETTLKELATKFDITEAALSQGLKRRGIKRGAKSHVTSKEIETTIADEQDKMIREIYDFKKRYLKYGDFLMQLTIKQITKAQSEDKKLNTIKPEIDTIIAATKVFKNIRHDMYHLYDLYDKDNKQEELQDFNIGVFTEEDIVNIREGQRIMQDMFKVHDEEEDEDEDSADDDVDYDEDAGE